MVLMREEARALSRSMRWIVQGQRNAGRGKSLSDLRAAKTRNESGRN